MTATRQSPPKVISIKAEVNVFYSGQRTKKLSLYMHL